MTQCPPARHLEALMPSRRTLAASILLRDHGPLHLDELGRRMMDTGATRAKDTAGAARDTVRWGHRFVELRDGRWMDRLAALDGAVLWHRVTSHERRVSALRMDPDLSVLDTVVRGSEVRPAGWFTDIVVDWIRDRRLHRQQPTPERFLALPYELGRRLRPGGLISVVVTGATFDIQPVASAAPARTVPDPDLQAVAADLLGTPSNDGASAAIAVETLLFEALARAPELLRASVEPVGEMLWRCDLATHRDLVATRLTDWARHDHAAAVWDLVGPVEWHAEDMLNHSAPGAAPATGWYDIAPVVD
jgi:hypothetical protein